MEASKDVACGSSMGAMTSRSRCQASGLQLVIDNKQEGIGTHNGDSEHERREEWGARQRMSESGGGTGL